jgi:polyisoprenoid-binding protein YceI
MKTNYLLPALSLLVVIAGCTNPADSVPTATTGEAVATAEGTGTGAAAAEGTGTGAEAADGTGTGAAAAEGTGADEGSAPADVGPRFTINGTGSTIGFVGSKVTGSHEGGFREFDGTIIVPDRDILRGSVDVMIQMSSIFADNPRLQGHLQTDDFFSVATYPTARFTSTSVVAGGATGATHTVTGNLEMRGDTRSITFPATITVTDTTATVAAEFSINRQEWGISYAGQADDLIRDEVVLKLNVTGTIVE